MGERNDAATRTKYLFLDMIEANFSVVEEKTYVADALNAVREMEEPGQGAPPST